MLPSISGSTTIQLYIGQGFGSACFYTHVFHLDVTMSMDVKVVAAVFITLFGIAVGMADGDLQMKEVPKLSNLPNVWEYIKFGDSFSPSGLFNSRKPANTSIEASFTADEARFDKKFSDPVERIVVSGKGIEMDIAGFSAGSDRVEVTLTNYTGRVTFNGNVSLDGNVEAIDVGSLHLESKKPRGITLGVSDPTNISMQGIGGVNLDLNTTTGRFSSGDTTVRLTGSPANLKWFEGSLAKNFGSGKYRLEGKVYEAVLGAGDSAVTIGGD
jgi:hypothetical protein